MTGLLSDASLFTPIPGSGEGHSAIHATVPHLNKVCWVVEERMLSCPQ